MSDFGFEGMSYSGGEADPSQQNGAGAGQQESPTIKMLRERGDKAVEANKALEARLAALERVARQATLGQVFQAKGYDPGAAALYQGEPDKLDEWLTANGGLLAKSGQQQAASAAGVVPPAQQADLQQMQQAGTGNQATILSGDDELAAALRATTSPEAFVTAMQSGGWQYGLDNMGMA